MPPPAQPFLLTLIAFACIAVAVLVFARTLHHLVERGGNVETAHFGLPDLLTGGTLAAFFIGLMIESLRLDREESAPVSIEQLLPAQLFVVAVVAGLSGYMIYRHMNPARVFGLGRIPVVGAAALAVLFLVAAMPIVALTNHLTVLMLRDLADEQDLVSLFRDVSREGDLTAMAKAFLATVVLAPPCEEFLFRGYFYGVGKRYLGALGSALATSLLFAAFHLNLASLPGLFVLALCLTAAYERTGSLLVPIGMHALYNCTSLVMLYFQARGKIPGLHS